MYKNIVREYFLTRLIFSCKHRHLTSFSAVNIKILRLNISVNYRDRDWFDFLFPCFNLYLLALFFTRCFEFSLQAMVRMDRNIPYEKRMVRVEEVIQEVNIWRFGTMRFGYVKYLTCFVFSDFSFRWRNAKTLSSAWPVG